MNERFTGNPPVEYKERQGVKPYVVSADIKILLTDWAKRTGYTLPDDEFFRSLRTSFAEYMKRIFPNFELISEGELTDGMKHLVAKSGISPLSLDRVYYRGQNVLDITRLVDEENNDKGLGKRPGAPRLLKQFRRLKELGVKEIVLIDDVIYTGGLTERVIEILNKTGIEVPVVVAGIAVLEGEERLKNKGISVKSVRSYKEVIDQVCERDFYPGVPFCGRTLLEKGGENVGVPYMLPFGNPGKWASIPEKDQFSFSNFCFEQTEILFREIGKASGKPVRCPAIERKTLCIRNQWIPFDNALRQTRIWGNTYPITRP